MRDTLAFPMQAERNVLPSLNNLLENREMALDDGRFLVSAARYDELLREPDGAAHIAAASLVRVHPNFRVIALGLPVPKFHGFPLDPPLRSRFQARVVGAFSADLILADAGPVPVDAEHRKTITTLLSLAQTLRAIDDADEDEVRGSSRGGAGGFHLSDKALSGIIAHLSAFPNSNIPAIFRRYCPYHLTPLSANSHQQKGGGGTYMDKALRRFGFHELALSEDTLMGRGGKETFGGYRLESLSSPSPTLASAHDLHQIVTFTSSRPAPPQTNAHPDACVESYLGRSFDAHASGNGKATTLPAKTLLEAGKCVEGCGGTAILVTDTLSRLISDLSQDLALGRAACLANIRKSQYYSSFEGGIQNGA